MLQPCLFFSSNFQHLYLLKPPLYRTLSKLCNKLGPVFLLQFGSRRVLVVSSPSLVKECLTKNDIIFANRPHLLVGKHLGCNYRSLSWAPYSDHWRNLRRVASIELLSANRLQMSSSVRVEEVKVLIRKLFNYQNQIVDMRTGFFELTLNIMMRMIAGKRYYGDKVSDMEEARRFRAIHTESFKLGGATNISDFVPWIKNRDLEKRMIECRQNRDEFMQCLIEQHRRKMGQDCSDNERKRSSMIEVLLSLQEKEPEYYSAETIISLMLTLLLGGTDTSINTMEWALSLLINHPQVLEMVRIEIEESVGHDRLIDETDLVKLPYLRSTINEAMRMYPAVPVLIPHESSEPCLVGGFRIPRGTMLIINMWAIQNDPTIWEDPSKFMPKRFEGQEGGRDGFRLMPFGYGRRGCPGEGLALRVVGLTLGSLIQCFEWEAIGDNKTVDMTPGLGITMPKAQPLKVLCRPRTNMLTVLSQA